MQKQLRNVTLPICAAIVVAGAWFANAGDLNPPAGPIQGTMHTLDEIYSLGGGGGGGAGIAVQTLSGDAFATYVIDQPGSYYLNDNINGESGKDGIRIDVGNVTLDLNGFALIGVPGSSTGLFIFGLGDPVNIAVRNGTITEWGSSGLDHSGVVTNCLFENLRASGNGVDGSGSGLSVGENSTVIHCTAEANAGYGIAVGSGCTVIGCTARLNSSDGITLGNWDPGEHAPTITGCSVSENGGAGIYSNRGANVTSCAVFANGDYGISILAGATVSDCVVIRNAAGGLWVGDGTVTACSVHYNGMDQDGTTVLDSAAPGISGTSRVTIMNCAVNRNTGDGIYVDDDCLVVGNTCSANDSDGDGVGVGIRAYGNSNRLEANNVVHNQGYGIYVEGAFNLVVKNSAGGNGSGGLENYYIDNPTYNKVGTITGDPMTAGPWANFDTNQS